MVSVLLWLVAGGVAGFLLLGSFVPIPGYSNVTVSVTAEEVSLVVADVFTISSVSGSTTGGSTVIDYAAASVLGISLPSVVSTFTMTVCLNPGNHCAQKSQSQWFPTVPFVNGQQLQATNSFVIGYVPSGHYSIAVTLSQSGQSVATGSASVCVPGC